MNHQRLKKAFGFDVSEIVIERMVARIDHSEDPEYDETCRQCQAVCSTLTLDGLCGACDDSLYVAHPDCDDDPLRYGTERVRAKATK